jgi:hypothetical protein
MVLQAYIDDSYGESGVHVLAGYIASAEAWSRFVREWEKLLPLCNRKSSGPFRFKMSEMAHRLDEVRLFLDVIRSHVSYSFSIMMKEDGLKRVKERLWSERVELVWYPHDDVNNVMLSFLAAKFFEGVIGDHYNDSWIGPDDKIDIYVDNDAAPPWALTIGTTLLVNFLSICGSTLDKARDLLTTKNAFLSKQLTFWRGGSRRGYENGNEGTILSDTFGPPPKDRIIRGVRLDFTEDQIVDNLMVRFKSSQRFPSLVNIYDTNKKPLSAHALDVHEFDKRQGLFSFLEKKLKSIRRRGQFR